MRKLILCVSATVTFTACGGEHDPAKDAEKVCDCSTKARAIEDEAKRAEERSKCTDLQMELWRHYAEDADKASTFNTTLKVCTDKFMQEDMEKMKEEFIKEEVVKPSDSASAQ